ncbi:hypothetical protein ACFS7Z_13730 [Pontibacter toksunensis]|uniref:Uncharacterized protein n=1 Tax=Pontibacter toksunensis TaxID=1332631 RepID=A0ABW6BWN2_9BACT
MHTETLAPGQKTEIRVEQKKQIKLIGSTRKVPGHTMFELNLETQEIKQAEYQEGTVYAYTEKSHEHQHRLKLVVKENCIYVQALNKKNAFKKLAKIK